MTPEQEIEQFRREHNIPIFIMCNTLDMWSENQYYKMRDGKYKLSTTQLIAFIAAYHYPLKSLNPKS